MSRGEDAPGVAQLREEVARIRGDVDHIRSAMQDMHREVGSAVLLLSRFIGLEWDTGEAVRLAEKRSASASDAVERLSDDVGNLEQRLAVAGKPRLRAENELGGGSGGGGSGGGGGATSETVTSKTVEGGGGGGATHDSVNDSRSETALSATDRQDRGGAGGSLDEPGLSATDRQGTSGAASDGDREGQNLPSDRPRGLQDRDRLHLPNPLSENQRDSPRHQNDGSKGEILAPTTGVALTDHHVKGAAARGGGAESHNLKDGRKNGPGCPGKEELPPLSPDSGEEGVLLSRRPSSGGTGGATLPAVNRSQEGTTVAVVATAAVAAVAKPSRRTDALGGGALGPSSRVLGEGGSTRLRLPPEEPLPVLGVADGEAGRSASVGKVIAEGRDHDQEKERCLEEETGEDDGKNNEEKDDKEEEGKEEGDVEKEDEEEVEEEDGEEDEEEEEEKESVAHATQSDNIRKSGPTSLARTGGPLSDKHGDTQKAGARRPLVAKTLSGEAESDSSGSRRRGEDDASSEIHTSVGDREKIGSRSVPQDERMAAADHTKHHASDEERSTAGGSTATPPVSPPAISARSNSGGGGGRGGGGGGGGGGDGGGGGGGGGNTDDASQTSGSWTSRSSDSQSSDQSATSTPRSNRGRDGPNREVAVRGRPLRAAAAVAAASVVTASSDKAAVAESIPNEDNEGGVMENGEAIIHSGGRGSQQRLALRTTADDGVPAAVRPVQQQSGSKVPSSSGDEDFAPTPTLRLPTPLGARRREREEQGEESSGDEASHTSVSRSREDAAVVADAAAGPTEVM